MAADCKSAAPCGLRRFESSPVHEASRLDGSAHVAQLVERVLGKDEVTSSILVVGSRLGRGSNSVARVTAFQAVGRGFESRLPLFEYEPRIARIEIPGICAIRG
jgi:hypothetical protein